jgi:RND superfamily putative drug exporter
MIDVPDWSTSLAAMMGIGIDRLMLLMVTRFKEWRAAGLDPEAATVATLDTAGRSVLVAGAPWWCACWACSRWACRLRGAAVVTIMAVLVMAAAGRSSPHPRLPRQVDRPLARSARPAPPAGDHGRWARRTGPRWVRWSRFVTAQHRHSIAGVAILLLSPRPSSGALRFP